MCSLEVMEDARSNLAKEIQLKKAAKATNLDILESYFDNLTMKIQVLQISVETGSLTPAGAMPRCRGAASAGVGLAHTSAIFTAATWAGPPNHPAAYGETLRKAVAEYRARAIQFKALNRPDDVRLLLARMKLMEAEIAQIDEMLKDGAPAEGE